MKKKIADQLYMQKYIFRYIPFYALLKIILVVVTSLLDIFLFTYSFKFAIDAVEAGKGFFDILPFFAVAGALSIITVFLRKWVDCQYFPICRERLAQKMKTHLMEKASAVDLACYDQPEYYDTLIMANQNADTNALNIFHTHVELLEQVVSISGFVTILLSLDALGVVFAVVSLVMGLLTNAVFNRLQLKCELELAPLYRKRDYTGRIFFLPDYAKELRMSRIKLPLTAYFKTSIREIVDTNKKYDMRFLVLRLLNFFTTVFLTDAVYMAILVYRIVVSKTLSVGDFTALYLCMDKLSYWLPNLMETLTNYQKHSLHTELFQKFENYQNTVKDEGQVMPGTEAAEIEINNLSFRYPGTDHSVLKDIDLHIRPGEKIAIVGYNGSGKSTLVKLLMRFYDPDRGEIKMQGRNIREYRLTPYRKQIGAVFQDYCTYACSVAENVSMDTKPDEEQVWHALKKSGLAERIDRTEHRTASQFGRELYEDGLILSGGEAHKIALSRAFYHDCRFVILDEPSAALDPISEYSFYESVRENFRNATVIFISHRLSSTRGADRIYMMSNGEIIEQGTHDELMKQNGAYAASFRLQAEKYVTE